jgi:coenzyme F420-0:L-glutamate ligase/coenzyme F420-1:gamma-L-glutamate ligase
LITILGLKGIPLIKKGDDLSQLILAAARKQQVALENGDILVITQKIVSKAEGRTRRLAEVAPSGFAKTIAASTNHDPRHVEIILQESLRAVRMRDGHLIMETKHGFVCANSGVDRSNVEGDEEVTLLPIDPDSSAERIRKNIGRQLGIDVVVVITDTFGRAWRTGQVNFAIGLSGMRPEKDYRGSEDMFGYKLIVTKIAVADELAAAGELVMNKTDQVPVAVIKGYRYPQGEGTAKEMVRPIESDLFR